MMETNKSPINFPSGRLVIRLPGVRPLRMPLSFIPRPTSPFSSTLLLVYGFGALIFLGTLLLIFPFSSVSGEFTSPLTALFTATSAASLTGLVVVDTGTHWSIFGQIVVFCLFQIGGLGFIIGATLMLLAIGGRFGLRDRLLISESLGVNHLNGILALIGKIALFSFLAELSGTLIFYFRWSTSGIVGASWWTALFHSASAFNNCGLDIFGNFQSLSGFNNDGITLVTTALLIITGSTGYFIITNILKNSGVFHRFALDTKVVIFTSLSLIIGGTLLYFIFEFNGSDTLNTFTFPQKLLGAFFQSVTVRTAGFSSFNTSGLSEIAIFLTIFLMFVGGTTGSTAGGIKVNTLGTLIIGLINILRGRESISAFGRQIAKNTVFRAMALAFLYLAFAGLIIIILSFTENFALDKLIFETFSALGTVGQTTGITPTLSMGGKLILVITMFVGRLGPLTFIAFLVRQHKSNGLEYPHETIKLG